MKKQWKGFLSGVIFTALLLGITGTALATVGRQTVEVDYSDIKVTMNGQPVALVDANGNPVEPFTINGTTYLPVRAISTALGLGVNWNQESKTVQLSGGGATPNNTVIPTGTYSRTSPAPVGTAQSTFVESWSGNYSASVVVLESYRGAAAWKMIQDANMFNSAPAEGMEYIVAKIRVSIDSTEKDTAIQLSEYSFSPYSSDNVEYKSAAIVDPEPAFSGNVFAGGTLEGYVTYQVSVSDNAPKIVFGAKYDGSNGIWFSLV